MYVRVLNIAIDALLFHLLQLNSIQAHTKGLHTPGLAGHILQNLLRTGTGHC